MLQSITEYYSIAEYCRLLQNIAEYCRVLQSVAECYRVLQSITEYCRVVQSNTEYYRVLQSITKTNLAHLLGPIFGLVFKHLPLGVRMETVLIFSISCFGKPP